jgi:predicted ATPase
VFVDLSPCVAVDDVPVAIAQALVVKENTHESLTETLRAVLADREMVLVLDNAERVVESAPLIGGLLSTAPALRLLVTGREPLRLRGESVVEVQPLPAPSPEDERDPESMLRNPAVALFVAEIKRGDSSFSLTPDIAGAVAEVCRALDGLPLALELAATQTRALGLATMREHLDRRLGLLSRGPRDLPARQQTLRDTIAWSYGLLEVDERRLFRLLGAFPGGARLDAIDFTASGSGLTGAPVLELVCALVDKSLVRRVDDPDGSPRFTMLDTIREFAVEALEASDECDAVQEAQARFMLSLASDYPRRFMARTCAFGSTDRMVFEIRNIRVAFAWFDQRRDAGAYARLVYSTSDFFIDRGLDRECAGKMHRALELMKTQKLDDRTYGELLIVQALTTRVAEDEPEDMEIIRESVARLRRDPDNRDRLVEALLELSIEQRELRRFDDALISAEEGLALALALDDPYREAHSRYLIGKLWYLQDNWERAAAFLDESLRLCRQHGSIGTAMYALGIQAIMHLIQRKAAAAAEVLLEAERMWKRAGNRQEAGAFWIGYAAAVAAVAGHLERAAKLFGFTYTFTGYCGVANMVNPRLTGIFDELRSQFVDTEFEQLKVEGFAMTLDEAATMALDILYNVCRDGEEGFRGNDYGPMQNV